MFYVSMTVNYTEFFSKQNIKLNIDCLLLIQKYEIDFLNFPVISDVDVELSLADKAIITVTTNMTGADGVVVINVDGVNYTADIKNTTASVTIANLAYGTYNVTIYYNGNNRYNAANATAKLGVAKLNTTIVANAVENVIILV